MSRTAVANYFPLGFSPVTLPLLNWRISSIYSLGALTVVGAIDALNTAFATEGTYWGVNYYSSAAARVLELKRINSPPAGESSTARLLFFGATGSAPNVNALDGDTANANRVYQTVCVDANTSSSGPPTLWTSGSPYSANGNTKGIVNVGSSISAGSYLWFAECEAGIVWIMINGSSGTNGYCGIMGQFWDDFSGSPKWINATSSLSLISSTAYPANSTAAFHVPGCVTINNVPKIIGAQTGSGTLTDLGRISDAPMAINAQNGSALYGVGGTSAILEAILLGGRVRGSGDPYYRAGKLRQIMFGPSMADRGTLNIGGTDYSYFAGSAASGTCCGVHLALFAA